MESLIELIFWPLFSILEAVAGIFLWTSDDPRIRRLQRTCLAILVAGCVIAIGAVALAFFAPSWHVLALLAVASVCFIGSGALGNRVERLCKAARKQEG